MNQSHQDWDLYVTLEGIDDLRAQIAYDVILVDQKRIHGAICPTINEDNGALSRNKAIASGENKWIAYIDDDDLWLPEHLSTLVELAEQNPEANMLRTAGQSFKVGRKSPRSNKRVTKLGPVNTTDILTVGMAHTRQIFYETCGWQPVDNHDKLLWGDMLEKDGITAETDKITFLFEI
jgi:glycosyltransferase involved in cell wall biosynthesis